MCQDSQDGFLKDKGYILMDRDGTFCPGFRGVLRDSGMKPVRLPPHSPNLNSHLERWHRSLKEEVLSRMIFFSEESVRRAVKSFIEHFHTERNHQGLDNKIIEPGPEVGTTVGKIECREGLGGLLNYYYRKAG
jgi:putative transposase